MKVTFNNKTYQVEGELTITEVEDSVDPDMKLGINTNWSSAWDSPKYFVNLARNMGYWSGEGITQRYGKILECDPNTTYSAGVLDKNAGVNAKPGIYHIKWEGEGELSINGSDGPTYLHDGVTFIQVEFKGTKLDELSVVHEDDLYSFEHGFEWSEEYIEFIGSLPIQVIRAMNWAQASESTDQDWIDRVTLDDISFNMGVPIEASIQFANYMSLDLWLNCPVRASTDYQINLANIVNQYSDTDVYLELGNEIWNYANPWKDGTLWIDLYGLNRKVARCTYEEDSFVLANHGLTTGDTITCFNILTQEQNNISGNWKLKGGISTQVTVIDSNNFYLKYEGKRVEVFEHQTEILFSENKYYTASLDEHYAWRSETLWKVFKEHTNDLNITNVLASQSKTTYRSRARYDAIQDKTSIGCIAIAPYYAIVPSDIDTFSSFAEKEINSFPTDLDDHSIDDIPVVCYEGGPHITATMTPEEETWLYSYWKSDYCANVIEQYKGSLKAQGIKLFCYYKDSSITRFGLCTDINLAQEDGRYRGFIK